MTIVNARMIVPGVDEETTAPAATSARAKPRLRPASG
jgi:hypothetical protein